MNLEQVETEKLKDILKQKERKLLDFYNSNNYKWLLEHPYIKRAYYSSFIKYKLDFYKKSKCDILLSKLNAEIDSINRELDFRATHVYKLK